MSRDQRPGPIRTISTVSKDVVAAESAADDGAEVRAIDVAHTTAAPARGMSLSGAMLFLVGCAGGGVGVAALPYVAPQWLAGLMGGQ